MGRNYAPVFHEYLEEMEQLTDEEFGRLVRALLRYSAYGEAPEGLGNERFYLRRVMAQEDRCQASYQQLSQKRSEAGKRGAQARWQNPSDPPEIHGKDGKDGNIKTNTNTKTKAKTKHKTDFSPSQSADARVMEDALRLKQWCQRVEEEQQGDTSKITMDNGAFCS